MIAPPKQKKKMNPMLINVLIISGAAHVLALLVLGGITVVKYIIPDDAEFEEPAVIEQVEPPKEVKVDIKPPAPTPQKQMSNLRMRPMANIAISSVDVALPSMDQSFTVSTGVGGLGGNLMGSGGGSIGIGMSNVNVFGLESRGEKILFVIQADKSMVYDSKGGITSYKVIKDEIANMVGNLSAGTLFNVILLGERGKYKQFKPQLVAAGASTTAELAQWFAPVNASISQIGLGKGSSTIRVQTQLEKYPEIYAGLRSWPAYPSAITQLALETKVDAIFMIRGTHSGYSAVRLHRNLSPAQTEAHNKALAEHQVALAEYKQQMKSDPKMVEMIAARAAEERVVKQQLASKLAALNAKRAANGLPPRVNSGGKDRLMKEFGIAYSTPRPPRPPSPPKLPNYPSAPPPEIRRYFKELTEHLYLDRGERPPSINIVLFLAEDEEFEKAKESAVKQFVRDFNGRMKIIRGLGQIKGAARAADTRN